MNGGLQSCGQFNATERRNNGSDISEEISEKKEWPPKNYADSERQADAAFTTISWIRQLPSRRQ